MKKLDRKTAIALSLFFALVTAYIWNVTTQRRVANAQTAVVRKVAVAVAAQTINPREAIRPGMVRYTEIREDQMPAGAIVSGIEINGKFARTTVPAGNVLTSQVLEDRGPNLGMAFNLPEGTRAVAVPLDPVSGVAGFLKPGDHVDVIATYSGNGVDVTRTVLQDILLLAIGSTPINTTTYQGTDSPAVGGGQDPNKAQADAPTATLAVWPDQAQSLVLAAAKARIHLALRPADDVSPTPLKPTTTTVVFGPAAGQRQPAQPTAQPAPAPAPAPQQPVYTPPPAPTPPPTPPPPPPTPPAPPEEEEWSVIVTRGTTQETVKGTN